jgi:glycerol kinase
VLTLQEPLPGQNAASYGWLVGRADHILAIDQGTTSTRAILFDGEARPVAMTQRELAQHYPQPGWVEHDPEDIWRDALAVAREALAGINIARVAAIGITNQRETAVVWDRASGEPIHRAIVWQDRRTAGRCAELKADGAEGLVSERTGLLLDPYFSASKIAWILDHVPGARERAEKGELAFGTIDSFLLWRLTGGAVHATDVTNASRTSLFDIRANRWDSETCRLFGVPEPLLPEVHENSRIFGTTAPSLFDAAIPIAGMAGDQQAALFGQACFEPGMAKSTYGTGCFMLLNTGKTPTPSKNGLLTTVGWKLGNDVTYALEGSVFIAGAAVQWLRDGLKAFERSSDVEALAASVEDTGGVYVVPAFVGLGAPYWDPWARGAILGLTRGSGLAEIARATIESIAYQVGDVLDAMAADTGGRIASLRVDGGAAANDALLGFQADILGMRVERPVVAETTALGAAYLAGLAVGFWKDVTEIEANWALDRRFEPSMDPAERDRRIGGWHRAVERTRGWAVPGDVD